MVTEVEVEVIVSGIFSLENETKVSHASENQWMA